MNYDPQQLIAPNTMLFIRKSDDINWEELNNIKHLLIVCDEKEKLQNQALSQITAIYVRNLLQAFFVFCTYYRNLFDLPVVAITGTCGKTTTKEMLKHILSNEMNVQTSVSSKNEPRQSLPYLLGIDDDTKAAVFELGLGNSGNISYQCQIYQPTIGVITNIGVHHLDGCKNLDGYIKAKSEILYGIRAGGTLIINSDDENTKKIPLSTYQNKVFTFGIKNKADIYATAVQFAEKGMKFQVHVNNKKYQAYIPGYGEHQVYNVLAVLAVIHELGLSVQKAILQLRTFEQMERHLQFSKGVGGSTIIDDTWTNNPTSLEAALKVLDSVGNGKKRYLVLGDIKRLGKFEKKYHMELGSLVATYPIHTLITVGTKAENIAKQAIADGTSAKVYMYKDIKGVYELLEQQLDRESLLLIKGPMSSRAMIQFAKQLKSSE
ncbi:UDP-N-acetylmuramoyl-tripeptide--D-alanyl-D-alanine ligase [Solibacillus daqui]|uniref:UDP-N-acetylmuramoyl-tripeptide--D-alanyl-D- alanine ligase n=1 Tax=Solibacillus daqui TaxID=2912187 RepID=UPI002365913F|nr:UDP-N-acetylmuramoyl-tripeptide--D-alanyl-D-alanine ligase [Solibacillus daqui]